MSLRDILNACIDHVMAPECAFDPCSDGFCSAVGASSSTTGAEYGQAGMDCGGDWTNAFGTACDYQIPAESDNAFQSADWSSTPSGASFGSSFHDF